MEGLASCSRFPGGLVPEFWSFESGTGFSPVLHGQIGIATIAPATLAARFADRRSTLVRKLSKHILQTTAAARPALSSTSFQIATTDASADQEIPLPGCRRVQNL